MTPRLLTIAAIWSLLAAAPASAHHVVWLDFSQWNLGAWTSVNGHKPATAADQTAIRDQIIAGMIEDYALFDIYFTTVRPANGRYTRVYFYANASDDLFGCAGPSCCQNGNCSGIGTWTDAVSDLEVYTGSFATEQAFTGTNATTVRIANGISHTASHELGHVLGLTHCHAADDFTDAGVTCAGSYDATSDENVNWHIMASGRSDLTAAQRATRRSLLQRALRAASSLPRAAAAQSLVDVGRLQRHPCRPHLRPAADADEGGVADPAVERRQVQCRHYLDRGLRPARRPVLHGGRDR